MTRRALVFTALGVSFLLMTLSLRADIRTTPHNLARKGGASAPTVDANDLCPFCHTPTVSDGTPAAPRWQRQVETSHVFPTFDDIGTGDRTGRVGSHSIVCLSCHDALQADTVGMRLGTEISIDSGHPVGVPYRGALNLTALPRRSDFDYRPASSANVGGHRTWWVSPRGPGSPRSRDDLPFFTSVATAGGEPVPLIECGTCHDPHSTSSGFLRMPRRGSVLCLTCHNK